MMIGRRTFGLGAVATLSVWTQPVGAQAWPARPVRWIVPYPPGGAADFLARLLGQKLSERLGQPVLIEARPGAGGNVGTDYVAKSPPDGYTIVLGTIGPISVNRSLYPNLPFDVERDFAPITMLVAYPSVFLVHPSFAPKSIKDLVDLAKAQPGKPLSYGSTGTGTSQHLTGELFAATAGIQMVHVPYKGSGPALNDAVAGHVPMIVDSVSAASLALIRGGKLRALAVTSAQRTPLLPDVPTVSESGLPGFEVAGWIGVLAPANTPPAVLARLTAEFTAILQTPDVRARLEETSAYVPPLGPEYFRSFIRSESARWQKVVQAINLKVE